MNDIPKTARDYEIERLYGPGPAGVARAEWEEVLKKRNAAVSAHSEREKLERSWSLRNRESAERRRKEEEAKKAEQLDHAREAGRLRAEYVARVKAFDQRCQNAVLRPLSDVREAVRIGDFEAAQEAGARLAAAREVARESASLVRQVDLSDPLRIMAGSVQI